MKISAEELSSAISEIRDLHEKAHHGQGTLEQQLLRMSRGESLGCPICDVGGKILSEDKMCEEFNKFLIKLMPTAAIFSQLFRADGSKIRLHHSFLLLES